MIAKSYFFEGIGDSSPRDELSDYNQYKARGIAVAEPVKMDLSRNQRSPWVRDRGPGCPLVSWAPATGPLPCTQRQQGESLQKNPHPQQQAELRQASHRASWKLELSACL